MLYIFNKLQLDTAKRAGFSSHFSEGMNQNHINILDAILWLYKNCAEFFWNLMITF